MAFPNGRHGCPAYVVDARQRRCVHHRSRCDRCPDLQTRHRAVVLVHRNKAPCRVLSDAIAHFSTELAAYGTTEHAIQLRHDAPLPTELIREIIAWRLQQLPSDRV
jgi:hypothetical protein